MIGAGPGFGYDELPGVDAAETADLAVSLRIGRLIESTVATIEPRSDFGSRVMDTVLAEPEAHAAGALGRAIRNRRPWAGLLAVRDAWRLAWAGGWPSSLRLEALAVVLVAVLAFGSIGGTAVVGGLSLLNPDASPTPTPAPSIQPTPSVAPTPEPTLAPTPTPSPSPEPTDTAEPTETPDATETPEAEETPESTDDNSGPGGGGDSGSGDDSGSGGPGSGREDGSGSGD